MPLHPPSQPRLALGLALGSTASGSALSAGIALAKQTAVDRLAVDGRLVEAVLGAPAPTVPLEPVPDNALDLGLLELEEEVLTDAYELARDAFDRRLREWRSSASLAPLEAMRTLARGGGVSIDVLATASLASWSDDQLDYIGRVAVALGAHTLAAGRSAPPSTVAAVARRHHLRPAIVATPHANRRDLARSLDVDPTLTLAVDLAPSDVDGGAAASLVDAFADRLSHVYVGMPDSSVGRTLRQVVSRDAAVPIFIVTDQIEGPSPNRLADIVRQWRELLDA